MVRLATRLCIGFLVALTLAQGQTSQSAKDASSSVDSTLTEEDYAIAAAALTEVFAESHPDKLLLIDQTSIGFPPGMAATTSFGGKAQPLLAKVPKEEREGFDRRNKNHPKVDSTLLRAPFQIIAITPQEASQLVEGNGSRWETFRKRYPKTPGVTLFSLPGISSDHRKAMFYVGNSCDMLCGNGYLILLGKEDDHWRVLDKVVIWVS